MAAAGQQAHLQALADMQELKKQHPLKQAAINMDSLHATIWALNKTAGNDRYSCWRFQSMPGDCCSSWWHWASWLHMRQPCLQS